MTRIFRLLPAFFAAAPLLALAQASSAAPPNAPKPIPEIQWVFDVGGDFGSKTLTSVGFTDGTSREIMGNQGVFISGGASFLPLADGQLRTRATIGYKFTSVQAGNGSVSFAAFPLEVLETVELKPVRLSAGLYTLLAPEITGDGPEGATYAETFDTSVGFALRADLFWGAGADYGVGVRYVWNRIGNAARSVDAPAFGFVLTANTN